jgi:hypothetical protein
MIQRHGSVIIDARGNESKVRRRQFGPRQGFKIRDVKHLTRIDSRGVGDRIRARQAEAKPRHTEERRRQT